MTSYRKQIAQQAALLLCLVSLHLACSDGGGAGASCVTHSNCASSYQCLNEVCVPRCTQNSVCGDGYQCSDTGICDLVISKPGQVCTSEWGCGLGQSCVLNAVIDDTRQIIGATCQQQGVGSNIGSECAIDEDCQNQLCTIGHCSQVCAKDDDCPAGNRCVLVPRDSSFFAGCLPSTGVLKHRIPMTTSRERLHIPVPSDTHSLTIVSSVDDEIHRVGATRVVSPDGSLLFNGDDSPELFQSNPIRYLRQRRISTMMIPNSDNEATELISGFYQVDMEASLSPLGAATAVPEVEVFYKMDDSRTLDLHFYFLNLEDHPCRNEFGIELLNANNAAVTSAFQGDFLGEIERIFGQANINTGIVRYSDIDRADLDGIVGNDVHNLLELAENDTGLAVFFVRSLAPDGVQALIGGIPGPPRTPGTSASGIAISADTLCYRSWSKLARVAAHSMGTQMGLWNNRNPEGLLDSILDTDGSSDNLMFFGEFGGTDLTRGQSTVLSRYPGLR